MLRKSAGPNRLTRRGILRFGLLVLTGLVALVLLALPIAIRLSSFPLNEGDVASQDMQAPYASSFDSAYLTQKAQDDAESSVQPVFLPVDPSITRRQSEHLRVVLEY